MIDWPDFHIPGNRIVGGEDGLDAKQWIPLLSIYPLVVIDYLNGYILMEG